MIRQAIVLVAFTIAGCSPPVLRGDFSLLSTEDIGGKYEILADQKVTGRACYNMLKASVFVGEGVFDLAVKEALANQPDGVILVDAEFVDHGSCIIVTGSAAKLN